jgi:hypothetical protein
LPAPPAWSAGRGVECLNRNGRPGFTSGRRRLERGRKHRVRA